MSNDKKIGNHKNPNAWAKHKRPFGKKHSNKAIRRNSKKQCDATL